MKGLRRAPRLLINNWQQKLGALLLATLIWVFVNVNQESVTVRSLLIPITVEGLSQDSVVTGLPDFVEVTFSGPSGHVERLRQDSFEANLDLSGQSGSFEVPIQVLQPRGVELRRVNPTDVIGTIEPVTAKQVPVVPVVTGTVPADQRVLTATEPEAVTVRARSTTLDQVDRVVAPVGTAQATVSVAPFAVSADGRPVSGVTVTPAEVIVQVQLEPVLTRAQVPVDLDTPSIAGFEVLARMEDPEVSVIGPPSIVQELESLSGTVALPTEELGPGSYTLPVNLALPEGVRQEEEVRATVRLSRPPLTP